MRGTMLCDEALGSSFPRGGRCLKTSGEAAGQFRKSGEVRL